MVCLRELIAKLELEDLDLILREFGMQALAVQSESLKCDRIVTVTWNKFWEDEFS